MNRQKTKEGPMRDYKMNCRNKFRFLISWNLKNIFWSANTITLYK